MLTKKLNSYANTKQASDADLPLIPKLTVTQKYTAVSTASQGTINLSFSVDQANKDNFLLFIDGALMSEGASNDYTFTNIQADNTSSQISLAATLVANLNILAYKVAVVKEVAPSLSNLKADICRRSFGVNYILNGNAEYQGTTGWNMFNDGAGTIPVDGNGGTATSVWGTTTSALRGATSWLYTKDAANRNGEGVAYDFDIDPADKNCTFYLRMDCSGSSGYVAGYLKAFLFDLNSGALISPAQTDIPVSGVFETTFSTTNSTRYRLVLFVADTSSTAWTMSLDEIQTGLKAFTRSTAGSGARSFNLVSAGFGTLTSVNAFWWRNNEYMEMEMKFVTGTNTATQPYLALPAGYTLDPTRLAGTGVKCSVGTYEEISNSTLTMGAITGVLIYDGVNTDRLFFAGGVTLKDYSVASAGTNYGSTTPFRIYARVPIVGWTADLNLADTKVEYAYNTSTADSDDTTSFAFGSDGVAFGSFTTAERSKRVRFSNNVQSTDHVFVEVQENGKWVRLAEHELRGQNQGTSRYGVRVVPVSGSNTDYDVKFGNGGGTSGATYAGAGNAWSGFTSLKWRLVKSANALAVESPGNAAQMAVLRELQSSSTNAGTFTSGAFRTRTLNTLVKESSDIGWISLASNQFTLQAGRYEIEASAPAYLVGSHLAKLKNITDGTDDIMGTSEYSPTGTPSVTRSVVIGTITISAAKTFELQHICGTTRATDGMGVATGLAAEMYAVVKIRKKA